MFVGGRIDRPARSAQPVAIETRIDVGASPGGPSRPPGFSCVRGRVSGLCAGERNFASFKIRLSALSRRVLHPRPACLARCRSRIVAGGYRADEVNAGQWCHIPRDRRRGWHARYGAAHSGSGLIVERRRLRDVSADPRGRAKFPQKALLFLHLPPQSRPFLRLRNCPLFRIEVPEWREVPNCWRGVTRPGSLRPATVQRPRVISGLAASLTP